MAQPVNSTSSSSTTPSESNKKRTREQPNLSECHSCLTRINHTCNPQERLQPLPSLWRIVLLCKKCINNFSNTCTYCFKPINTPLDNINNNIVTCTLCNNRIHLQCVTSFKDSAPWRYMKEEFTVCVDCWVPDSLKKAVRRVDRGNGGVKNRKFVFKGNESRKFKRRIDAIQIMDDKELAVRFRNVFSSFPRIERSEFSLDSRDVNVWKIRYWGGISYKRSRVGRECGEGKKVGFSCLENSVRSDGEVNIGLVTYKRDKKRKVWKIDDADIMVSESGSYQSGEKFELRSDKARTTCSTDVSKDVLCVNGDKSGDRYIRVNAGIGADRFGEKIAIYKRSRFRGKGQVNGTVYESGECRVCDNHECACKIKHRQPDDEKDMTRIIVECDGNEILPNGNSNTEHDRYRLKYFKRVATTKSCSTHLNFGTEGCKNKCPESALSNSKTDSSFKCVDELRLPNENGDAVLDRYCLKYVKRVKGSESGIKC